MHKRVNSAISPAHDRPLRHLGTFEIFAAVPESDIVSGKLKVAATYTSPIVDLDSPENYDKSYDGLPWH